MTQYSYSFWDLYPYFILIIVFVWLNYASIKNTTKNSIAISVLLFFLCFRFDIGWDYMSYVNIINDTPKDIEDSRYEIFSKIIFIVANKVNFYPLAFITYGIIQIAIINKIFKKISPDKILSWTIFLLMPVFFLQGLSTLRQQTAFVLVFYSYLFLRERNYLKYSLCIVISAMFHTSGYYGLSLLFFARKEIPQLVNWILFALSFFVSDIFTRYIATLGIDRLDIYLNVEDIKKTSTLNYLYYLINTIVLIHYKKLLRINKENAFFIQLSNWGIVTFNLFIFEPITSTRLSVFFISFWLVLLPEFSKIYRSKLVLIIPFIILNLTYLMIYVKAFNEHVLYKVSFIPYKFWWNHL